MLNIANYERNANQTAVRYHLTPVRMAVMKKSTNKNGQYYELTCVPTPHHPHFYAEVLICDVTIFGDTVLRAITKVQGSAEGGGVILRKRGRDTTDLPLPVHLWWRGRVEARWESDCLQNQEESPHQKLTLTTAWSDFSPPVLWEN